MIDLVFKIGDKIKHYRELRKYSQKDFAEKIGVSNSRVSNWEQGLNRPDCDMIRKICKVLNVSPSELLDVHLNTDELTEHEKQIIKNYRMKIDLQKSVNILLGLEQDD